MAKIYLAFTGDVMLGRTVNEYISRYGAEYVWGNALRIIRDADLAFINLECAITSHKEKSETGKPFYFRADPAGADVLKSAGIKYASLANNHILDFQEEGMLETIELLDKSKIAHAGAGKNLEDASKPAFLAAGGLKFAVLSYADYPPGWAAKKNKAGFNYTPVTSDRRALGRVKRAVRSAKQRSDFVIFSVHWGPNMNPYPAEDFIKFAHAVMDAGADIFHGHSAHIFQPIEIYSGKSVFYDCGDFVDDYAVDADLRNDYVLLYFVILDSEKKAIDRIELIPCLIHSYKCQVNLAEGLIFEDIAERTKALSASMGTEVKREKNRLAIDINSDKK